MRFPESIRLTLHYPYFKWLLDHYFLAFLNIDAFLRMTDATSAQVVIFRIRVRLCLYLLNTRRQRDFLIGLDQVPDGSTPRFRFGQNGAEGTGVGIPAVLSRRFHNGNAAIRLVKS